VSDRRPASALVVVAHADDCELSCGGTVAKWTRAGTPVTLVVLTDGSKGSHDPDVPDAELRERREREQEAAARLLGVAEVAFWRQVDGELREDPALVERLAATIREERPEVVITHDPWRLYEIHPDHVAAGRLVVAAAVVAREPRAARQIAARGLPPWRPRALLLFEPQETNHVEDIGDTFEAKLEAVLCHESQYSTSFGIREDADRETFAARLRAHAEEAAVGEPDVVVAERFREISLS
jgi:LmbE family N-acetylglucosaminyl deacetylase